MNFHRKRGAAVMITVVLALAACGGDDAGSEDASPDGTRDASTVTVSTNPPPDAAPATGTPGSTAGPPASTNPSTSAPITTITTSAGADRGDLDPLVVAAIDDLALTQNRSPDEIDLVTFERVTWRDGSLGCPQPDRSYTQALVNGYRIVLSVDGALHDYHGADTSQPFPCDNPVDPAPGGGGGNADT